MVRFHALGTTQLLGADGTEARAILSRPKRLGLFAYLALARPRGFHRRDALAALFWPELDQARARAALRQSLHAIRQAFGPGFVLARGDTEIALDSTQLWCDAIEMERLSDDGDLAAALDRYQGPLLPAFHLSGCVEAERWLDRERDWFARRAMSTAAALVQSRERTGDLRGAIDAARGALELAPYDEPAARTLIGLLARTGARGDAIQAFESLARRLAEDMELEPSAETLALVQSVRASPAPPAPGDASAPSADAGSTGSLPPATRTTSDFSADRTGHALNHDALPGVSASTELQRTRSRHWIRALPVFALVLAAAAYAGTRKSDESTAGDARRTIAVLPFTVAGDTALAYLGEGLADLLSTNLDGAGDLRAVDPNVIVLHVAALGIAPDLSAGRAVAARFDAGLFVVGDLIEWSDQARATASLYDARGVLLGTAQARIDDETRLFDLVDELARQLVALSPVQPHGRLARSGALTTESFPAVKAYLRAEGMLRAGRYDSAVAAYERAVAADTAFALAWYRMSIARHLDATPSGPSAPYRRALALADRLSPRDRLLVQAFDAYQRHQDAEAERLYRDLLSIHPDEVEAWVFLGEIITFHGLWRGRPIADARHALERALALDSTHVGALKQLLWVAAIEERFDESAAIAERLLALEQGSYYAPAARLQIALTRGDATAERKALAVLRTRESVYVNWAQRWAHFSGNLEGRMRTTRLLTEPSRPDNVRRLGHVIASRYLLDRGRRTAALEELSPVQRIAPDAYVWTWSRHHLRPFIAVSRDELANVRAVVGEWRPASLGHRLGRLYALGLIAVRLRDTVDATRLAGELDATAIELEKNEGLRRDASLARDYAHGVRAWRAAELDRPEEALAHLDSLRPESWWQRSQSGGLEMDAVQSWLRAEVLVRLGRDREAIDLYAPLGFLWGDAGLLAAKHLRLGEIHERLGDRTRASHHYRRFVTIWRDCDPELRPLVRDVEARIARLGR